MENTSNQENITQDKDKYLAGLYIAIAVALIGVIFLYSYYNTSKTDLSKTLDSDTQEIFTYEEKIKILGELAGDSENIPSIEERKEILNAISENKPIDAREYSQEEKLNILYSLQ